MCTPWRHIGGVEVQLRSFLISALNGGEWLTSRSDRFTLGKALRCLLNRRVGGLQRRYGRFVDKKTSSLCWDLNPWFSSPYRIRYTDLATQAPTLKQTLYVILARINKVLMFSAFLGHKFRKFLGNPSPLSVPGARRLFIFQKLATTAAVEWSAQLVYIWEVPASNRAPEWSVLWYFPLCAGKYSGGISY